MSDQPNIILILSDDHGGWAMGCAGNKEIRTPNLDKLAANGMRFSNFFCASPVCSPARASLLTGRIPSAHGVHDWLRGGNTHKDSNPQPIEYLQGLTGYTEILAENGYTCGLSGKWHLGDSIHPQKGYSHWYVHQTGGGRYYNAPMIRDSQLIDEPGYITDNITDDALSCLDQYATSQKPFYHSIHYTAPHSPWIDNHPQDIVDSYDTCAFDSCPQDPLHPDAVGLTTEVRKDLRKNLQGYFAAVTAMDANIGRVLDKLETLGMTHNTLVIYMSDNGYNCGQHGFWGKGNGTFPFNMYDNSVKVPAIFSHPGHIPQGQECTTLLSAYDFMPTLLNYVGLDNPQRAELPGQSFLPTLNGEKQQTLKPVVIFDEYGPVRMIRDQQWKYIHRYPYGPHELYDLHTDAKEEHNLIENTAYTPIADRMRAQLEAWFLKYVNPAMDGARLPVAGQGQVGLVGAKGEGKIVFKG